MSRSPESLTPLQQRIRAAAMATGRVLDDVAGDLSFSAGTLRKAGGEGPGTKLSAERLDEIAKATGAPPEWIEAGWDAVVARGSESTTGSEIEWFVRELARAVERSEQELTALRSSHRDLSRRVLAIERRLNPCVA